MIWRSIIGVCRVANIDVPGSGACGEGRFGGLIYV